MASISYSQLLSAENNNDQFPYAGPRVSPQWRKKMLNERKIQFTRGMSPDVVMMLLLEKVSSLPEGTIFSLGSLVKSEWRGDACTLGHLFAEQSILGIEYGFISGYTGKALYRRTGANKEAMQEEWLEMTPLSVSAHVRFSRSTAPHLRVPFSVLMTSDNIPMGARGKGLLRITMEMRQRNLRRFKLDYTLTPNHAAAYEKIRTLIATLPPGTFFSPRSIFQYPNSWTARTFSTYFNIACESDKLFERVGSTRPYVYRRTAVDAHLEKDFEVTLT